MVSIFKRRGVKTPWHLRVLYISTFLLRTAFGALLLLIALYVPITPAVDVGLDPDMDEDKLEAFATLLNVSIGAAATVAPAIAMIADHADSCDRGRQMGWFDYSTFLGYIIGAVVGGFMIDLTGAKVGFIIIAALLVGSAVMLYTMVKSEKIVRKSQHYAGCGRAKRALGRGER